MKKLTLLKTVAKHFLGILLALALSATLSALVILYTPLLFNLAFKEVSELAAEYKEVEMSLYEEPAFRSFLQVPQDQQGDKALFNWLKSNNPDSRRINNFFSRGLKVRKADNCQYIIYGKHRVLDFFWIIEGGHCEPKGRRNPSRDSEVSH